MARTYIKATNELKTFITEYLGKLEIRVVNFSDTVGGDLFRFTAIDSSDNVCTYTIINGHVFSVNGTCNVYTIKSVDNCMDLLED